MSNYTKVNLADVEDMAPGFGMSEFGEARGVRDAIGAQRIGMTVYRINPDQRVGFGHTHSEVEEAYFVLAGAGRFKVDDDVFDVAERDVVYVAPGGMREWESGPDGMELLAFGGHPEQPDSDMQPGWWTD